MEAIQQTDDRRAPWVSHANSRVALIASTLPGAYDEGHRLSISLLKRFSEHVLARTSSASTLPMPVMLDAVRNAFSGMWGVEGWGLHFGVVVATEACWRVWTTGLVYCARWSPGEWKLVTKPQSAARQLREQGVGASANFAENVAVKVARPSTAPEDLEYAEVSREPTVGVVLLGSAEAGRRLEAAASHASWRLTSAVDVLDCTAPLAPGSPVATLAALVG